MFRRKEENSPDSANDSLASGGFSGTGQPIENASATATPATPASVTTASAIPSASHSTYAPSANGGATPSARPASPASSTSAPSAGASYRPTPIADFTRGAAPRASEPAARTAPIPAASSSFGSAPTEKTGTKTNRRVLTVGNDILLKGEIATCDRLVIEGRVEAKLSEVHTVEIAECGSFKGTAEVEDAEISGVFEGDLVVRNRLVIYATGEVRGNISYGEIEIERGGRLTGQIKTVAAGMQGSKIKSPAVALDSDKSRKEASNVAA